MSPKCHICGKPATCFGSYERNDNWAFSCSDCCGHGNEDGTCADDPADIGDQVNVGVRESDALYEQLQAAEAALTTQGNEMRELRDRLLEERKWAEAAENAVSLLEWTGGTALGIRGLVVPHDYLRGVLARVAALEKALKHLLDDWERTSAGFPQHIEIRYACRDEARAALGADKGAP